MLTPLDLVERRARAALIPPPRLCVSDWLDARRVIGRGYPSPFPGPWKTERTPYLREPLDDFVSPEVETIVLLLSSQIGKTEALMGTMLYALGVDPGPAMFVLPTLELAGAMSTDRIALALRSCASLRLGAPRGRNADDAILHKRVNGHPLTMCGANSPASLSSRPVRYVWCDEIDRWPATTPEGDPLTLVRQRTEAYRQRRVVLCSTPTVKGASRIEDWYARSDQHELWSPCPRCGHQFVLAWRHVRWDKDQPETARIECPECHARIEEAQRMAMIGASEWRARGRRGSIRGYRTWAIVSPWTRLSELASAFLAAKMRPETLQAFINLKLGESWEVPGEGVESSVLLTRREEYATDVPAGAKILTAGVDTQDDRLAVLVVGWGPGEEAWVIARETIYGDPDKPDTWARLDQEILLHDWSREAGGHTRIQCAFVDALGHRTTAVYSAVVARQHRRVFASIGKDGGDSGGQLVSTPKTLATPQGNVIRYIVDASQAKALVYARLRLDGTDAGPQPTIHFPMQVGDAFFSELTAETLVTERNKWGVPSQRWVRRPGHTRNESLDCLGMALAALRAICPTPARFDALAARVDAAALEPVRPMSQQPAQPKRPRGPRVQSWDGGL